MAATMAMSDEEAEAALQLRHWIWRVVPIPELVKRMADVPVEHWTSLAVQEWVVEHVLRAPLRVQFPTSAKWLAGFCKRYFDLVDAQGDVGVAEGLIELLFEAKALAKTQDTRHFFRIYQWSEGEASRDPMAPVAVGRDVIVVQMDREFNQVGRVPWLAGSLVTNMAVAGGGALVDGARVLELGAGVGMTGAAIAHHARPARLVLTDGPLDVLANLEVNMAHNGLDAMAHVEMDTVDWETIAACAETRAAVAQRYAGALDLILAADCVYAPSLIAPFVATLETLLTASPDAVAYIVSMVRNEKTVQCVWDTLNASTVITAQDVTEESMYACTHGPIKLWDEIMCHRADQHNRWDCLVIRVRLQPSSPSDQ